LVERGKDLDHRLKSILEFDKSLRTINIIGPKAEAVAGAMRSGVVSMEPDSETQMIFRRSAMTMFMGASDDKYHGHTEAIVILREKLTAILYPAGDKTILVSAESSFPLNEVRTLGRLLGELGLD
jgi:hypothetical protein